MATDRHHHESDDDFEFEILDTPQNNRIESTYLVDLRRHPRSDTSIPGEAIGESGEHVYVTITNISLRGLRLEGSSQTVRALIANPDRSVPDTEPRTSLKIHFSVPSDSDHLAPVKIHCRTAYTRHAGKDTYQIGMEFLTFEEGRAALVEYLSNRRACG